MQIEVTLRPQTVRRPQSPRSRFQRPSEMAPRSPPEMMDDVIIEILLRLPPDDDTACLARASLVCKAWHRLLADRAFLRRYRHIHGSAPFLGFLLNNFSVGVGASGPLFLRTTPPSPFPQPAPSVATPTYCRTLDCRHGRVLLYHPCCPVELTLMMASGDGHKAG